MPNPQHLAIFAAIIRAGSISAAAAKLGCGKSVVSRQLARLEDELGTRLVQRSTRRLALTEIGQLVLEQARQIERALENIDQITDDYQQHIRGTLRVSAAVGAQRLLVPLLAEFVLQYPKVKIALELDDQLVDLITEQVDVAIRTSDLVDSSLVARKLVDNTSIVAAAPSYLARAGTPRTPQELREHACLMYINGGKVYNQWAFIGDDGVYVVQVDGPLQFNDGSSLVTAAVAGAGIVRLQRGLLGPELARGDLVQVLAHCPLPPSASTYAIYPAREFLPLKTATFIAFLQQRLQPGVALGSAPQAVPPPT